MRLLINVEVMEKVKEMARRAGPFECSGLLASAPTDEEVTAAFELEGNAGLGRVDVAPAALAQMGRSLADRGLIPRGIWHSHGLGPVFHSAIDRETTTRLLRTVAEWRLGPHAMLPSAPLLLSATEALLPDGGNLLRIQVEGSTSGASPGSCRWEVGFLEEEALPHLLWQGGCLTLRAGRVELNLKVPEGAALRCAREAVPVLVGSAFSLVVNARGEACAYCLRICELDGEQFWREERCEIEVRGDVQVPPADENTGLGSGCNKRGEGGGLWRRLGRCLHRPCAAVTGGRADRLDRCW